MNINEKIKTEDELNQAMRKLVVFITEQFECSYNLPLTPEAQATFIRTVYFQAQQIKHTEPFARIELKKALDEYNERLDKEKKGSK